MADARRDAHAHARPHRHDIAVEIHPRVRAAFEEEVRFGERLVIVQLEPYAAGSKPWSGKQLKKFPADSLVKTLELRGRANK